MTSHENGFVSILTRACMLDGPARMRAFRDLKAASLLAARNRQAATKISMLQASFSRFHRVGYSVPRRGPKLS